MISLLQQPIIEALGWALVHSLWQFPILIGLAYLVSMALPRAVDRHRNLLLCLLALPIVFSITLYWYWPATFEIPFSDSFISVSPDLEGFEMVPAVEQPRQFADYLPWLTIAYLFGLCWMMLRTAVDLGKAYKVRQHAISPSASWQSFYAKLATRFNLPNSIEWKLSDRIRSALTVGIIRPVVLFPVGLLNQLTPEETEAILLHEIAHLLRKDHWWNGLQILVSSLFFYHPLVHLLCRQLDLEREYACDDFVTQHLDRQVYAQSLVNTARYSITLKNQFVMQAQGKSHFSNRLQRLFLPASKPKRPRVLLLLPLLIVPLFWWPTLEGSPTIEPENEVAVAVDTIPRPNLPDDLTNSIFIIDGERVAIDSKAKMDVIADRIEVRGPEDPLLQKISKEEGVEYSNVVYVYSLPITEETELELPTDESADNSIGYFVDGVETSGAEVKRIPVDAIMTVDVIKGEKVRLETGRDYQGVVMITTSGDYELMDRPLNAPQELVPGFLEAIGPGFSYDNTVVFINGKRWVGNEFYDLSKLDIAAQDLNIDPASIKALGFEGYRAILRITTKSQYVEKPLVRKKPMLLPGGGKVKFTEEWDSKRKTLQLLDGKPTTKAEIEALPYGGIAYLEITSDPEDIVEMGFGTEYDVIVDFITTSNPDAVPFEELDAPEVKEEEVPVIVEEVEVPVVEGQKTPIIEEEGNLPLVIGEEVPSVKVERAPSSANLPDDNLLIIVDGNRTDHSQMEGLIPNNVGEIEVIKDQQKIAELGHGTGFDGAIIITTKEGNWIPTPKALSEEIESIAPPASEANFLYKIDGEIVTKEDFEAYPTDQIAKVDVFKRPIEMSGSDGIQQYDGAVLVSSHVFLGKHGDEEDKYGDTKIRITPDGSYPSEFVGTPISLDELKGGSVAEFHPSALANQGFEGLYSGYIDRDEPHQFAVNGELISKDELKKIRFKKVKTIRIFKGEELLARKGVTAPVLVDITLKK